MPSLFAKVGRALSRNRRDRNGDTPAPTKPPPVDDTTAPVRASADDLGGPYETVSPSSSPSAANFPDVYRGSNTDRGRKGLPGFLSRFTSTASSIPLSSPIVNASKRKSNEFLQLPADVLESGGAEKASPTSQVPPEKPNGVSPALDEHKVNEEDVKNRVLTPSESLKLVKATSTLIKERGLETLGIFKPHWYSASAEKQARIISLFLASLAIPSPTAGLAPTSTAAAQAFESELYYSESPHDVAEVFKWALRHLILDAPTFGQKDGSDKGQWQWYETFSDSEKSASYPTDAYSKTLLPLLPATNAELLNVVLDLTSSVASHADSNAMSGSKLSKVLAWWLVSARLVPGDSVDWSRFYLEWEFAARALEHVFLAYIRDLGTSTLPKRLKELISKYPYSKLGSPEDGPLLPKPRFTTRTYPAILVQLKKDKANGDGQLHPVTLIEQALKAEIDSETHARPTKFWETLAKDAQTAADGDITPTTTAPEPNTSTTFTLNHVFADETLEALTFIPVPPGGEKSVAIFPSTIPGFVLTRPAPRNRRSFSMNDMEGSERPSIISTVLDRGKGASSTAISQPEDWSAFSSGGFGELTSIDSLAKSLSSATGQRNGSAVPSRPPLPLEGRKSSMKANGPRQKSPLRVSLDTPPPTTPTPQIPTTRPARVVVSHQPVEIDEAFVDVWLDNILDPVPADTWPRFILCKLKAPVEFEVEQSKTRQVQWLIVEQVLVSPPPPPPIPDEPVSPPTSPKRPTPSIKGKSRLSSFLSGSFRGRASSESGVTDTASIHRVTSPAESTKGVIRQASKRGLRQAGGSGISELGETVKEEDSPGAITGDKTPTPKDAPQLPAIAVPDSPIVSTAVGVTAPAVAGGLAVVGAGVGALASVVSAVASTGPAQASKEATEASKTDEEALPPKQPVTEAPPATEVAQPEAAEQKAEESAPIVEPQETLVTPAAEASSGQASPTTPAVIASFPIPPNDTPTPEAKLEEHLQPIPDVEQPGLVEEKTETPAAVTEEAPVTEEDEPATEPEPLPIEEEARGEPVSEELDEEIEKAVEQQAAAPGQLMEDEPTTEPAAADGTGEQNGPDKTGPILENVPPEVTSMEPATAADLSKVHEAEETSVAAAPVEESKESPADTAPEPATEPVVQPIVELSESEPEPTEEPTTEEGVAPHTTSLGPVADAPEQLVEPVPESAAEPAAEATTGATESKVVEPPRLPVDDTWSNEPDLTETNLPPSAHSDEEAEEIAPAQGNAQEVADGETDGEKKLSDDAINHDGLMQGGGDPSIAPAAANAFVMTSSEGAPAESDVLPDKIVAMQDDSPEGQTVQVVLDHAHQANPAVDTHVNETFVPIANVGQPELLKPADEPEDAEKPTPEPVIGSTPPTAEEEIVHADSTEAPAAPQSELEHTEVPVTGPEEPAPPTRDVEAQLVGEKPETSIEETATVPAVEAKADDVKDDAPEATAAVEEPAAPEPSTETPEPPTEVTE